MFKRVRWMSIGAAVGLGGSVWAQRRVRRAVDRYLPEQVVSSAGQRARNLRSDVRDALTEGRLAMRDREEELRAQVEGRSPAAPPLAAGRPVQALPSAADGRPGGVIDVDERRADGHPDPQGRRASRTAPAPPGSPSLPGRPRGGRHRRR
jgi:hypothetical protein